MSKKRLQIFNIDVLKSPSLMEAFRIGLALLLSFAIYTTSYSQGQSGYINYQGVASNATGETIANENITVKIALRPVFPDSETLYEENHPVTTDKNGVFSLQIGNGTVLKGDYYLLDWQLKTYVTVSIDGVEIGTTEMNAVPYALRSGDPKYWSEVGTEEFKMVKDNSYSVIISNKLKVDGDIKLQLGSTANEISVDGTLSGNSDEAIPTEKAVKTYVDANSTSGLETLDEGNGIGWRLKDRNREDYGLIGENAVDLSTSVDRSNVHGATGLLSVALGGGTIASEWASTAMGRNTIASEFASTAMGNRTKASGQTSTAMGSGTSASGETSTAMGYETTASGDYSMSMGYKTKAESYVSMAIGSKNLGGFTNNPGTDNDGNKNWFGEDPLFEIGNASIASVSRKNALTVLKNGKVGIGNHKPSSLLEVAHKNGRPTSTNSTNAFSIRNLVTDDPNDDRSWQFYTHPTGYLELFSDGSHKGSFNPSSGAYNVVSDRKLKKEIVGLDNGTLNKVLQLRPVSYLFKDQKDTKRNLGLISQEVKEIFPSLTHYVKESNLLTLSYTELIPILIKAIQEQQQIIEGQNTKIESLSADVSAIKTMLENMKEKREVVSDVGGE